MISKLLLIPAAIGSFAAATPAEAATLLFDFTGGARSFSFNLEQGQTPDRVTTGIATRIFYDDVAGFFQGVDSSTNVASSISFANAFNRITLEADGFGRGFFGGPNLFNGSTTNPIFNLGTFDLTQVSTGPGTGGGTLTISEVAIPAVPEPSTWAMLILGFAGIGFSIRKTRKPKVETTFSYA